MAITAPLPTLTIDQQEAPTVNPIVGVSATLAANEALAERRRRGERVLPLAFGEAGVPVSHVRGLADVIADEQVLARNMVKRTVLGSGKTIPTWGVPVKVNEDAESRLLHVPSLDQHREEILLELQTLPAHAGS